MILAEEVGCGHSFTETQANWRHVDKGHQFNNMFACGSDRRSVVLYSSTVMKIPSPRNQRDGTAMMTFGRAVASIREVDRGNTKLRRFFWTKLGGQKRLYM